MDILKAELAEFQTLKDLKTVLSATGPCVSVYMQLSSTSPAQNSKMNSLEWKNTLRGLNGKVGQFGEKGRELIDSLPDWQSILQLHTRPQGKSVAVFRSPEVFRATWLDRGVVSRAFVGPRFHIRPLLPDLTRDRDFYLLALSQNDVRLLRCSTRTSEEIPFPAGTIGSFEVWMNTAKPDHVLDNRGSVGPTAGHMKGVMFSTSSDREAKGQYLSHFFKQIDRGVNELLRGQTEPLVLAAVEYERSLYRTVSSYPHLVQESVHGAPNGLKAGEMHARALEALERCYNTEVDNRLTEWNHKVGSGASNRLKDVVTAAYDGRVTVLLVSDSLEQTGVFDETTHTVKGRETGTANDEDLVNDAAVQTILHAGSVLVAPNAKMPNGAPAAAIYRF